MKTTAVILLSIVAASSAFNTPPMATRAIFGKTKAAPVKKVAAKKVVAKKVVAKKVVAKKVVAKKVVAKKVAAKVVAKKAPAAPPASKGYPSIAESAMSFKLPNISGGGNKASTWSLTPPSFADPKLQIERDPEFYAAAAQQRLAKKAGGANYIIEDGLTDIERIQRNIAPGFLTGSAKSRVDTSAIANDVVGDEFLFGLDADRFQLLFIAVFGLFTLVGSLSGRLNL